MRPRTRIALLALLLPACTDGWGCASDSVGSEPSGAAKVDERGAPAANTATGGPSVARDPEVVSAQIKAMQSELTPMPDTPERKKLERAAGSIDGAKDLGDPIAAARFVGALPEKVGAYRADAAPQTGSTPAEVGTATVVSRRYRDGESVMHVKVTDTADAPGLRRELAEQLTLVGNAPSGHQRGQLERNIPGVVAYHEAARASRALALVSKRFLVEVMVEAAPSEDVAWSAIAALRAKELELAH